MDKPTVMIYTAEGQGTGEAADLELFLRIPKQTGHIESPEYSYTLPDLPDWDASVTQSTQIFFNPAKNTRYFA